MPCFQLTYSNNIPERWVRASHNNQMWKELQAHLWSLLSWITFAVMEVLWGLKGAVIISSCLFLQSDIVSGLQCFV